MNSFLNKEQESRKASLATNAPKSSSKMTVHRFEGGHPAAGIQRKQQLNAALQLGRSNNLQTIVSNSPKTRQITQRQEKIDNCAAKQRLIQRKEAVLIPFGLPLGASRTAGARQSFLQAKRPKMAQTSGPVRQLKKIVTEARDLVGNNAQVHYHITYESKKLAGLHVTFTDTSQVKNRNWQAVYEYKHNKREWSGPHYTDANRPSGEELAIIQAHVLHLQQKGVIAWENAHAQKLKAQAAEKQRASLREQDMDEAFPALSAPSKIGALSPSVSKAKQNSLHQVDVPTPSSGTRMWDEDYGMTHSVGRESDDMNYSTE